MGEITRSNTVTSIPEDLTGQIFGTINDHVAAGGFGNVYRCEWRRPSTDPVKVAVKVIKFHTSKEDLRRIRREIAIWARLVHENIVSLLGTTRGFGPSPAMVSLWFPHGTLLRLVADKGGELSIRSKLNLLRDIASGLHYLHCSSVVHGDLSSSNILVDIKEGKYKARLTNFGLSTVLGGLLGDCAIEGSTVRYGAVRWTAPELLQLALNHSPGAKPTKQNDIYSFGCVMFHILTLLIPWDGLDDLIVFQKILSGEKITRPEIPHAASDITDTRWNEIEQCWSVDAPARPSTLVIMDFLTSELEALGASTDNDVLIGEAQEGSQTASSDMVDPVQTSDLAPRCLAPSEMEDFGSSYERLPYETDELPLSSGSVGHGSQPQDLTAQIFGTINDYVAAGGFGSVYRCEWRRSTGPVKVAVKVILRHTSEKDIRRIQREIAIWAHLVHDNIVSLLETTRGFGPSPALVSLWFPHGTLLRLIADMGGRLGIRSKLKLLHDIASGLHYLHSSSVIHGDLTSSNILVDIKDGEYKACLTDFGLSTVLGGILGDRTMAGSTVRCGAIQWAAPELLRLALDHPPSAKPAEQNDIYSFGRVMFHILTLLIPWNGLRDFHVLDKILRGEEITRPEIPHATPDITDSRWKEIEQCWSVDALARPSALMIMNFLTSELRLEALWASTDDAQIEGTTTPIPRSSSGIDTEIMTTPALVSSSNAISLHSTATASSLSLSRPFNVLIFGETGVGKISVINLIAGQDVAQTSPDGPTCTVDHTFYEISLDNHRFKLCEVSSIAPMNYFRRLFTTWRLKRSYKKLYKDDGIHLLLYCMRNSRAQGTLVRDYKNFTSIVGSTAGHVPVAAVVTNLEDYPSDMDDWWKKNEQNLRRQWMQFSRHACITSLPDD